MDVYELRYTRDSPGFNFHVILFLLYSYSRNAYTSSINSSHERIVSGLVLLYLHLENKTSRVDL